MIITLIVYVTIFIITYETNNSYYLQFSEFQTEEEIISLFEENKKEFVNAANDLNDYQSHWSLRKDPQSRSDFKSKRIRHNFYVVIHEEPYDELLLMAEHLEHNECVLRILKELNFKSIRRMPRLDRDSIYFIKQTSINYEAGIVYSQNQTPTSQYITLLTKIDDGWYYYESK